MPRNKKELILRPKEISNNNSQFYHEDEPIHIRFEELRQRIENNKRGGPTALSQILTTGLTN